MYSPPSACGWRHGASSSREAEGGPRARAVIKRRPGTRPVHGQWPTRQSWHRFYAGSREGARARSPLAGRPRVLDGAGVDDRLDLGGDVDALFAVAAVQALDELVDDQVLRGDL